MILPAAHPLYCACLCLILLTGCALSPSLPDPTLLPTPSLHPGLPPAASSPTATPAPSPTIPPDTGWEPLRPGLERRILRPLDDTGRPWEHLYLLRIEPTAYHFAVAYRPGQPQTLRDWQEQTGALVVINGGYFTEQFHATGLIIVDGEPQGVSYGDFAGMFAVTPAGPELRWLRTQPYDPAEPLLFALQSFPLLVRPGGEAGFPEEDGHKARRTVVAQDTTGRILFLVAHQGAFTLYELSRFLVNSDLDVDLALNLDGGPSSGIILAEPSESLFPVAYVPAVITIHPR